MTLQLGDLHARIKASQYASWQLYLLGCGVLISLGLYTRFGAILWFVRVVENGVSEWHWLVMIGIQGVLIGLVAHVLYDQGDAYAKPTGYLFGSKDQILLVRVGVMTIVSGGITQLVPSLIEQATEYLVIQTTGAVICLGILLVHLDSKDWNIETEWPGLVAGGLFAIMPSLL